MEVTVKVPQMSSVSFTLVSNIFISNTYALLYCSQI